ncbi:TonB-dependent receptor [Phenylobacterium sp. Root700]|uniref:TonB-dependent receptor n=1 Tax=Phenylobacterium sp. Root700 TaxID=1736591 RepID=UPI0006FCB733|nr:TonB-dependent receptor [Phenylobacterium sp. Root700]KRB52674.1 hypothetical protein ASE02_11875 [Phenylobacterium sp. Root700]
MRTYRQLALASTAVVLMSAGGALAQTTAGSAANVTLDELVVTAQKREQNINDVGMSISAIGTEEIAARGVKGAEDLVRIVPGFTFTRTQFNEPVYSLRGVGYIESSLAANPAVSVYVDEVPLPYPSMTRGAILDLQRVEVLKGPQGTLFGQNSTGGAINYVAARPTQTFEAAIDATYGRFDTVEAGGHVSGPITNTLAGRLSLSTTQSGPWQQSQTRNDELGRANEWVGRLLLEWRPSDDFTVLLNVNGWRDRSENQAPQNRGLSIAVPGNPLPPEFLNAPVAPRNNRAADWDEGRDFSRDNTFGQAALRIDWDVSDDVALTSITAYQRLDRDSFNEADGTPVEVLSLGTYGRVSSFVQELRLTGDTARLHWLVGANYQSDDIHDLQLVALDKSTSAVVGPFHYPALYNLADSSIETWALFASGEYSLSDSLKLELGARYTNASNSYAGCSKDAGEGDLARLFGFLQGLVSNSYTVSPVPGGCVTFVDTNFNVGMFTDKLDEDNLSWRAGLNWKATEDLLIYGNISKGYKAGNFPTLSASSYTQLFPVTQEELLAYEVGFKATFPAIAMQINGAAFYYDYTNKQLRGRVTDPIFGQLEALLNIPESHIQGVEGQIVWKPVEGLRANLGVSYLKTEIDGDFSNYSQFGGPPVNFTGNEFPYAPKLQASGDVEYRHASSWSDVDWFGGASVTYQSKTKGGLENDPRLAIDSYALVDLRLGLESEAARWKVTLWGRNVTDQYYQVQILKAQDNVIAYTGRPATYGVSVSHRF